MEEIRDLIKHIAPAIASALGGPFSGVATKYLTDKFLGLDYKEQDKEQKLLELLEQPENLHKLKSINKEFELEMKKLDIDIFKLEKNDKNTQKEITKSDNQTQNNHAQIIISIIFLSAYFLMLGAIFAVEASDSINMRKGENSLMGELQILFGVLTAGVGQILSFWFGGVMSKPNSSN